MSFAWVSTGFCQLARVAVGTRTTLFSRAHQRIYGVQCEEKPSWTM